MSEILYYFPDLGETSDDARLAKSKDMHCLKGEIGELQWETYCTDIDHQTKVRVSFDGGDFWDCLWTSAATVCHSLKFVEALS